MWVLIFKIPFGMISTYNLVVPSWSEEWILVWYEEWIFVWTWYRVLRLLQRSQIGTLDSICGVNGFGDQPYLVGLGSPTKPYRRDLGDGPRLKASCDRVHPFLAAISLTRSNMLLLCFEFSRIGTLVHPAINEVYTTLPRCNRA